MISREDYIARRKRELMADDVTVRLVIAKLVPQINHILLARVRDALTVQVETEILQLAGYEYDNDPGIANQMRCEP